MLVWLGTNLLFYMYVTPPMSHAASFFAAALLLWAWLRCEGEPTRRLRDRAPRRGSSPACAGRTRCLLSRRSPRRSCRGRRDDRARLARLAVGRGDRRRLRARVPAAALRLVGTERLADAVRRDLGEGAFHARGALPLPGVLFSPFHGLFLWTPILLPASLGLGALAVTDPRGKAMALAVVAEIYLISGYVVAFGHGFGQRLFISSLPFAPSGLAVFADRLAPRLPRALRASRGPWPRCGGTLARWSSIRPG